MGFGPVVGHYLIFKCHHEGLIDEIASLLFV